MLTWVNGRAAATLDVRDRGLNYGDGIFETMRVRRRGVRLLEFHLDRLADGCRRLAIAQPPRRQLAQELLRVAALKSDGVLKLVLTRGIGVRGYRPSGRERCTRVVSLHALARVARTPGPARVRLCHMRMGANPALAGLKTLGRLESVLARAEWRDTAIWEGLLRDVDDHIVCGTMTNVFIRRGARLWTPLLDRCGVAGVMRRWVLARAGRLRLSCTEARLRWRDLAAADEVFLTNAVAGIVPVAAIADGRSRLVFGRHDTADELRRLVEMQ